ncbi:MAG: phosphoribosylamine--glycine ligase [bacterium]|nr:phosphoribosylamine--glycine ligase [bacterium]
MAKNIRNKQETKVLVVGAGGREHALVWKLKQSRRVNKIFCAPGNAGISRIASCVNIEAGNIGALSDFAARNRISLTVVGPEQPLAEGIADEFQRRKLKLFGPSRQAAKLESSKIFAKEFMRRHHIPTPPYKVFSTAAEAIGFVKTAEFPMVIKADGLAAGKGAVVVRNVDAATQAIERIMIKRELGEAGNRILVESFVDGQEVSIMAIADGKTILPFLPSQDHKQAFEGDRGPNTGGMGAYCPTDFVSTDIMDKIKEYVLQPTLKGLSQEGINYRGVIYAGLMLTPGGPKVLEYNCRFGDPETQVLMPLLKSDLFEILQAATTTKLASVGQLSWRHEYAACVVMASKGYPGKYATGVKITGVPTKPDNNCVVFHSGTAGNGDKLTTSGGRVLGVTGVDQTLQQALNRSYRTVNNIRFDGAAYRKDIGFRVLKKSGNK